MNRKIHTFLSSMLILSLCLTVPTKFNHHILFASEAKDISFNYLYARENNGSASFIDINDYPSNEVIVTYNTTSDTNGQLSNTTNYINLDSFTNRNEVKTFNLLSNPEPVDSTPITDTSSLISYHSKSELITAIASLKQDHTVSSIQPNFTYHLLDSTDEPGLSKQWWAYNDGNFMDGFKNQATLGIDINVKNPWDNYAGGRDVIVAVLDSGIDYTHEDLKDVLWTNPNEIENDGIDNDNNGYIDDIRGWNYYLNSNDTYNKETTEDNHGTHCAGIIGASKNGVGIAGITSNANVKIMSLKALGGPKSTGTTKDLVNAIKYAELMGATICNISAGTENPDPLLQSIITDSSMLFVVAAGNGDNNQMGSDNDQHPVYPASFDLDNIISVANLQCNGILHTSSNYGLKSVDLAAPGTTIYSTLVNGRYGYLSGTSMAAPMVTGTLAMVYSLKEDITLLQAKTIILNTVKELPSLSGRLVTGGMLDIYSAISIDDAKLLSLDTTAPNIKTKIKSIKDSYKKKLTVTVIDSDNNLSLVRYAKGKKSISYFEGGVKGTTISLKGNSASLSIGDTSNYTVYALDYAGNETIKTVNITVIKPTKVSMISKKTLTVGKTYTLKPTLTPSTTTSSLTFTSSNPKVATIHKQTGKITGKKKGTVIITVMTENGLTAKCKLTIIK